MSVETFDSFITSVVKPFGLWQLINFIFCALPVFLPYDLLLVYITNPPKFQFNTDCFNHSESAEIINLTLSSVVHFGNRSNRCPSLEEELRAHRQCNVTFLYDQSRPEWRGTLVEEFDLVCSRAYLRPMAISMYNVGQVLSCFVSTIMADKFGRKPLIIASSFTVLFFSSLVVVTHSITIFLICQVLIGIGHLTMWNVLFVHLLEITNHKWRIAVTSTMQVCYGLGLAVFIPSIAYATQNWKVMYLVMSVLSCVSLVLPCCLSESPRWLMAKNRREEAFRILDRAARMNSWSLNKRKICKRAMIRSFVDRFEITGSRKQRDSSFLVNLLESLKETSIILKDPFLRVKLVQFLTVWFTVSVAYFFAIFNTSNINVNFYLSTSIICGSLIPSQFIRQIFLKKISLKASTIMISVGEISIFIVLIFLQIFAPDNVITNVVMIVLALMGKFLCDILFSILYNHTPEFFPTEVRVYTLGLCSGVARIGSIVATFMLNLGSATWKPMPMVFVVGLFFICIFIGFGFSENMPNMPDTIMDIKREKNKTSSATLEKVEMQDDCFQAELEIFNTSDESK